MRVDIYYKGAVGSHSTEYKGKKVTRSQEETESKTWRVLGNCSSLFSSVYFVLLILQPTGLSL